MLIGKDRVRTLMKYQIGIVIMDIIALVLLVYLIGAYGAILAVFVIDSGGASIIYMWLMKKEFKIKTEMNKLWRMAAGAVIAGLIMFAASYLMGQGYLAIVADLVILLLAYPPLLIAFGAISRDNVKFIKDAGKSMKAISFFTDSLASYANLFMGKD